MNKLINRTLAAALAIVLVFGTGTLALADRGGNGHGNSHANPHATVHTNAHASSSAKAHARSAVHGNSATAHSCVNPAGNTRGWCKSQMGGSFITGTVASINGNTALVTLSNGQQVTINTGGRNLTVGQQITLRGNYGTNNVFVPSNGNYSNYGGPYSGASVRGLIVSVSGNSIQIVQGLSLITIDATNAAARGAINSTLIPGRTITASGNWSGSTFVATSIQ